VGDSVLVHDDQDPAMRLLPGVVVMVQTAVRANDLGVRVLSEGGLPVVIRPRRLAVHLTLDMTEPCWRCEVTRAALSLAPTMATTSP
jgi:hypothetical protein